MIEHCPIKEQLAVLIFLRQMSIPFYLPHGKFVLVTVECF
jgi:hypothetical protein